MLLLIGDGGASGEGLLERLQSSLHFLSLAVALPAVVRDASAYDASASLASARADLIAEVLEDVRQQSGGLHLLAIVGCGGGADACLALVASGLAPRGLARLALVGGAYGAGVGSGTVAGGVGMRVVPGEQRLARLGEVSSERRRVATTLRRDWPVAARERRCYCFRGSQRRRPARPPSTPLAPLGAPPAPR